MHRRFYAPLKFELLPQPGALLRLGLGRRGEALNKSGTISGPGRPGAVKGNIYRINSVLGREGINQARFSEFTL